MHPQEFYQKGHNKIQYKLHYAKSMHIVKSKGEKMPRPAPFSGCPGLSTQTYLLPDYLNVITLY